MTKPFKRHLNTSFMSELLHGPSATVVRACVDAGLDVRLRGKYVSCYYEGRCLAKIRGRSEKPAKLEVHNKYLKNRRVGRYHANGTGKKAEIESWFNVTKGFAEAYAKNLPEMMRLSEKRVRKEEVIESRLFSVNSHTAEVCCFDRQIQLPGITGRMDVVGFRRDPFVFVIIEVKRNSKNSPAIDDAPEQLLRYLRIMDPDGNGLRREVAESYKKVCDQLAQLDLPSLDPNCIQNGMPVEGLLVLSNYNEDCRELSRAHQCAQNLDRPIYLWQPEGDDLTIPDAAEWTLMGE